MVYGKSVVMLISLEIPTLQLLKGFDIEGNGVISASLAKLVELQENHEQCSQGLRSDMNSDVIRLKHLMYHL